MKVIDFIIDYWPLLSPVILEIILRLTPTGKDLSIISNIVKILDKIIPNIRKPKGNEGIADFDKKGNVLNNVKVRTDRFVKTILLLFVFSISLNVANAQTWQAYKGIWFKPYTTPSAIPAKPTGYTQISSSGGTLWGYDSLGRFNLRSSGGGSGTITGGDEGLHRNGTNIRLGGTLNIDTVITGNGTLLFNNTAVQYSNGTLNINNPANTFQYLISSSAITADRTATLPLLTGNDVFTFNAATQTLTNKTLTLPTIETTGYKLLNPAGTFSYNILGGAITANRTVTYPVTTVSTTICLTDAATTNRLPYFSSNILTSNASYTFNPTGNVVTAGRFVGVTTATLPSLGLGAFAGDPSTLVNGDVWYSSTTNSVRARINGVSQNVAMNTAANNELTKSNGTATLAPSGIFSTASGDITLGDATNAGTVRTINTQGTSANIGITITPKAAGVTTLGGGAVQMTFNTADGIAFVPNGISFSNSTSTSTQTFSSGNAVGGVNGANLAISASNGAAGGGTGGNILLNAGSPLAGNNNGGNITLTPGVASGTGVSGSLVFETGTTAGGTLKVNDGANEQMGLATLVGGTVTVNNVKVTANTRIFLSVQTAGGTQGFLRIAARTAGTSFTITSTSGTETSTVAWLLVEPN